MPFSDGAHHADYRIYYEDTDAGGVVYHANYIKFAERARSDALRELGISQHYLRETLHLLFVVRHCEIEFLAPTRLDDIITLTSRIRRFGHSSMQLEQIVRKETLELARLGVQIVCIDAGWKPTRIPADIRDALEKHMRS